VAGPAIRLLGDTVLVVPVAGLDRLAAAVVAATTGVGELPEDRPFVGHLTLCRFREGPPPGAVGAAVSAAFSVEEVVLVRSRTLPGGAVHDVLERFPLAG
jgi:2'-5' RNA ligase